MDADYGRNFGEDGNFFTDFGHSLLVLTTVQSVTVSTDNGRIQVQEGVATPFDFFGAIGDYSQHFG